MLPSILHTCPNHWCFYVLILSSIPVLLLISSFSTCCILDMPNISQYLPATKVWSIHLVSSILIRTLITSDSNTCENEASTKLQYHHQNWNNLVEWSTAFFCIIRSKLNDNLSCFAVIRHYLVLGHKSKWLLLPSKFYCKNSLVSYQSICFSIPCSSCAEHNIPHDLRKSSVKHKFRVLKWLMTTFWRRWRIVTCWHVTYLS